MPQRQEVVNVVLAQLLGQRGLVALPEQILRNPESGTHLPDVLIDFRGLRMAIEAEFQSAPDSASRAYRKAAERVQDGIAHIGVAIVYPTRLRNTNFATLSTTLAASTLQFLVVSEIQSPETQLHLFDRQEASPHYDTGTINDLVNALSRCYEQLVQDETLERAVQVMHGAIELAVEAMRSQPAGSDRVAEALGIRDVPTNNTRSQRSRFTPRQRVAVNRISSLILVNALIFQEVLASSENRVQVLQSFRTNLSILSALRDHWQFILTQINYWPIFSTAHSILSCLSADRQLENAIQRLIDSALRIVACKAALRHDLAGRIYHRLLEESKYLGAYYTSVPSATLLLKLALMPGDYVMDWSDITRLRSLRIADLACGTGTLLMAAADAITDNYVRHCAENATRPNYVAMQRAAVEDILYGYDVLPSAVHLTASTLTLRVPDTPINATHLYRMPIGGRERALGSLEFIEAAATPGMLFGLPAEQVSGRRPEQGGSVEIPALDLCVMNPPFTRSVGGNLLFGHIPDGERQPMQERLRGLVRTKRLSANITAGLGSVFVALADKHIRDGGTIALVLPRSAIGGVSWGPTRALFGRGYHLKYVITSHEPGRWNFSENTSLSEVLLVARKMQCDATNTRSIFVNLWRQPRTATESLSLAGVIGKSAQAALDSDAPAHDLIVAGRKCGESFSVDWDSIRNERWGYSCAFAQTALNRVVFGLRCSELRLPGSRTASELPLCLLSTFARLGFDCRDIHDGFEIEDSRTEYAALWGHQARRHTTISLRANRYLRPLIEPRPGRPRRIRDADHLWASASRLVVVERMRLNTAFVVAARVDRPVLANVWWTVRLSDELGNGKYEKALALWLNSTLGIMSLIGFREETEGAWIKLKKPILHALPVLNLPALDRAAVDVLAKAFDEYAKQPLLPLPSIDSDPVRAALDSALSDAIGLPNLSVLRERLALEPILRLNMSGLLPSDAAGSA